MAAFPISRLLVPDHALFRPKRHRMVTSGSRRHATGLVYDRFFDKCVTIGPGGTHTVAEIQGPGLLVRFYFTLPPVGRGLLLRDLVLRVFYDGAPHASVEAPLGDFFGLPFGKYANYDALFLSCLSGGYLCRFPMPFGASIRLEIANLSRRAAKMVFFQANWLEIDGLPEGCPRFMASWRRENPTRQGVPYTILEREGSGWFVGCNLQAQARERFLLRPLRDLPFPQGWGLGMLEGWEQVFVDGESEPSLRGTGHEELFNGAWYFTRSRAVGILSGNLCRSYLRGRVAMYRHHLFDPIPFERSIRIDIDHGIDSRIEADYSATAYWYEVAPSHPLPALPAERRPTSWLPHAAQALALPLAAPFGLAAAAPRFFEFRRRARRPR